MPHIDASRKRLASLKASKAVSPEPSMMEEGRSYLMEDDRSFLLNKTSTALRTPSPLETSFQGASFIGKKQSTDSGNTPSLRKRSIGGGSKFITPQATSFSRMDESMSFRREQRGQSGQGFASERAPCSPQFIASVLAQRAAGNTPSIVPSFPSVVTVTKISFETKRPNFAK